MLDDTPPGQISLSTPAGVQITLSDAGGMLSLAAPLRISLTSALIQLQADAIDINTTGMATSSMVLIDNVPFGMHMHAPPVQPPGTTGPVLPV